MRTDSEETIMAVPENKSASLMFALICGYLFLYIERPWEVWVWLAPFHIERAYMMVALAIFALWRGKEIRWGFHPFWIAIFLLLHYALAPFAFSAKDALLQGYEYFKMAVFYFLMIWSIKSELELRKLVQAFVGILGFYMLHSFREYLLGRHVYRMGITRMIGVDQFANDPNTFGGTLIFSLPFLFALFRTEDRAFLKLIYVAYGVLAVACLVLTGSRSGFVILALFLLLDQMRRKGKNRYLMLVAVILIGLAVWNFMPEEKKLRFETIWNPEVGPANAEESAEGRIAGFKAGMQMLADQPLTGIGAGGKNFMNYRSAKGDGFAIQAHNLAGELLGTMGLLGGVAFLCQVIVVWRMAGEAMKANPHSNSPPDSYVPQLCLACRQDLILLVCSGLFGHNLYRANWLWIGAWSFLCRRFVRMRADKLISQKPANGAGLQPAHESART